MGLVLVCVGISLPHLPDLARLVLIRLNVHGRLGGASAIIVGLWQVWGACNSLGAAAGGSAVGTDAAVGGSPASSSLLSCGSTCLWGEHACMGCEVGRVQELWVCGRCGVLANP